MVTVTITIPDDLYDRVKAVSEQSSRSVDDAIVDALDTVYPEKGDEQGALCQTEVEEERRLLQQALGDYLSPFNPDRFLATLGISRQPIDDVERTLTLLPQSNPTLSQTIIDMRNEERY
jgi:predicted transcriptional regulator